MPHKRAKRSARDKQRTEQGHDLRPEKIVLSNEEIPKGVARVLNASQIQEDWRNKRKLGLTDDDGDASRKKRQKPNGEKGSKGGKSDIRIMPGESLARFNRRVEESLRPLVRDAMQASAAISRKARKEELLVAATKVNKPKNPKQADTASIDPQSSSKPKGTRDEREDKPRSTATRTQNAANRPTEFASHSTSVPRRLNDIVQAPPEIKKLPRGAQARSQLSKKSDASSAGQSLREGALSMAQKAMLEEERDRVIEAYRQMKKGNAGG